MKTDQASWNVNDIWETTGNRRWIIVAIDWNYRDRAIVAREVTPGAMNFGRAGTFDDTGKQVDGGSAQLERWVP